MDRFTRLCFASLAVAILVLSLFTWALEVFGSGGQPHMTMAIAVLAGIWFTLLMPQ